MKSGLSKILAKDAFGEQVLDQHALDGIFGEIGIDGLTAEGVEVVEAADEGGIAAALFVDDLLDGGGEFGDAVGEFGDGLFPLLDVGSFVVEEMVDDLDQVVRVGDVEVGDAGPGLVEDGAVGGLKDDVVAGVAFV